uniref:Uncharacterized protein n=1 Tax=Glossina morsitans morsitans TaxID=37546 RepID=A0A1B0G1T8_GLOMM
METSNFCPELLNPQWCCQCEKREPDFCEGQKLEPLNKEESICSRRLCAVFGKHDADPYEKPCIVKPKGQKYGSHNSLGDAVGMITADFLLRTDGRGFDIAQLRYATCLVAFGAFHIYPETVLNSTIFDFEKDNYQLVSPPDVYGPHEQEVLRDFDFNEFKFHVELVNIPYKALIHIMKRSDGGDMRSTLLVKRIKSALESVVREHTYYLLCVNEFYLMIWLNERAYFIFDVCGRRTTDFNTDEDEGVPMLIGLKTLDNVNHLILNLSGLNEVDPCRIRGLKIESRQIKLIVNENGELLQLGSHIITDGDGNQILVQDPDQIQQLLQTAGLFQMMADANGQMVLVQGDSNETQLMDASLLNAD